MQSKTHTPRAHANFIKAMKIVMAEKNMETLREAAEWLDIGRVSMQQIMGGNQAPTVEQCAQLSSKAGISADWLLLDRGEMKYEDIVSLRAIAKYLQRVQS